MITFLDGILEDVDRDCAIINVGGIGFRVFMGIPGLSALPPQGEQTRVYTWMQVREDGMSLYGFHTKEELSLFRKVISVSGIGPKGGLALLGTLPPEDLMFAIVSGDSATIAKAPGIGKRMAERLILELKDKVNPEEALEDYISRGNQEKASGNGPLPEALQALVALGYSQAEARAALKEIPDAESMDVQAILQQAFKHLI